MTRTINANIIAQLESEELRPFYLMSMDCDGTVYYYTDCDVPLTLTNTYNPLGFKFRTRIFCNIFSYGTVISFDI